MADQGRRKRICISLWNWPKAPDPEKLNQGVASGKIPHKIYQSEKIQPGRRGELRLQPWMPSLNTAASLTVEEVAIGMAHRGRLNVLANILGKHTNRFYRIEGNLPPDSHHGSAMVHHYSSDVDIWSGMENSLHLETVPNPRTPNFVFLVVGFVAQQGGCVMCDLVISDEIPPLLCVHTEDASIAVVRGIVYGKRCRWSKLRRSAIPAGTIHFVINNDQIKLHSPISATPAAPDYCTPVAVPWCRPTVSACRWRRSQPWWKIGGDRHDVAGGGTQQRYLYRWWFGTASRT